MNIYTGGKILRNANTNYFYCLSVVHVPVEPASLASGETMGTAISTAPQVPMPQTHSHKRQSFKIC